MLVVQNFTPAFTESLVFLRLKFKCCLFSSCGTPLLEKNCRRSLFTILIQGGGHTLPLKDANHDLVGRHTCTKVLPLKKGFVKAGTVIIGLWQGCQLKQVHFA